MYRVHSKLAGGLTVDVMQGSELVARRIGGRGATYSQVITMDMLRLKKLDRLSFEDLENKPGSAVVPPTAPVDDRVDLICLHCGWTKRDKYSEMECPNCGGTQCVAPREEALKAGYELPTEMRPASDFERPSQESPPPTTEDKVETKKPTSFYTAEELVAMEKKDLKKLIKKHDIPIRSNRVAVIREKIVDYVIPKE